MAFDPEFFELMSDSVTYRPLASTDAYGDDTLGAPVAIEHCRIVTKRRMLRTAEGDEREVNTEITTGGYFAIEDTGVMVIDGVEYQIAEVETFTDEDGPHHQKVLL